MDYRLNRIEDYFNYLLWGILAVIAFFYFGAILDYKNEEIVRFEIPDKTESCPYTYSDKDGKKFPSRYYLSWYYPQSGDPVLSFYDPVYRQSETVRTAFIHIYKPKIGEPSSPVWLHRIWYNLWDGVADEDDGLYCVLAIPLIPIGMLIFYLGGYLKNFLLYHYARKINNFEFYAALLRDRDRPFRKYSILRVIEMLRQRFFQHQINLSLPYGTVFYQLISNYLTQVESNGNTKITYYLHYDDKMFNHQEYLALLRRHWEQELASQQNPDAERFLRDTIVLQETKFSIDEIHISRDVVAKAISQALENMFRAVLKADFLTFQASPAPQDLSILPRNELYIKVRLTNGSGSFVRNQSVYLDSTFFSIQTRVSIYQSGRDNTCEQLWDNIVDVKCSYKDKGGVTDAQEFYNTMVHDSIQTIPTIFKR